MVVQTGGVTSYGQTLLSVSTLNLVECKIEKVPRNTRSKKSPESYDRYEKKLVSTIIAYESQKKIDGTIYPKGFFT